MYTPKHPYDLNRRCSGSGSSSSGGSSSGGSDSNSGYNKSAVAANKQNQIVLL